MKAAETKCFWLGWHHRQILTENPRNQGTDCPAEVGGEGKADFRRQKGWSRFSGNKKVGVSKLIISNSGFLFSPSQVMAFSLWSVIGGILPQPWGLSRVVCSYQARSFGGTREAISRQHIRHFGAGLLHEGLPMEQPLLYRPPNTFNIGIGPPLVTTEGITPFHFSIAVCRTSILRNSIN